MHVDDRITLETDAVSIVSTLIWWGNDSDLIWTKAIIARITNRPMDRIQDALQWLWKNDMVSTYKGEYIVTDQGINYYEAARRNPHGMVKGADIFRWKEEVLTGLVEKKSKKSRLLISEKSDVENGVLPTTKPVPERITTPEDILCDYESRQRQLAKIARDLGITPEQVIEFWNTDRIHICAGGGDHHLGLFDKGQTVCKRCTKKRGRKK